MNQPYLIAMHGEPGSGKDAVAKYLVEHHGFHRLAFADRLKECCEALNPIVGYQLDTQLLNALHEGGQPTFKPIRLGEAVATLGWEQAKRQYPEIRRTQRYLATEVVRDLVNPTYWVDHVAAQLLNHSRIVITDLRFPNEAEMVHRAGGKIWWITRKNNPHRVREAHVSESWHPKQYVSIGNDGSLDELAVLVDLVFDR